MDSKLPLKLFYSYSHKDEELRKQLEDHLKSLQRRGYIEPWNDRDISAGDEWKNKISEHLEQAEIILLLISSSFIASEYCYDIEMQTALRMHDEGKAVVIPVILRECNWEIDIFSKLQAIPKESKAVKSAEWFTEDAAFTDVSKQLQKKIEEL
jgi:internalin A